MADSFAGIQVFDALMDLSQLPLFGVDKRGDRFCRKKGLRALGSSGKCIKPLLGFGIDPDGKSLGHSVCLPVYIFTQRRSRQDLTGEFGEREF